MLQDYNGYCHKTFLSLGSVASTKTKLSFISQWDLGRVRLKEQFHSLSFTSMTEASSGAGVQLT